MTFYKNTKPVSKQLQVKGKKIMTDRRLNKRHFPDLIPQTSTKKQRRKCFVCSHKTEGKKEQIPYTNAMSAM